MTLVSRTGYSASNENGRKTFRCAPDCGGAGVIEGEISAYDAEQQAAEESKREINESRPMLELKKIWN